VCKKKKRGVFHSVSSSHGNPFDKSGREKIMLRKPIQNGVKTGGDVIEKFGLTLNSQSSLVLEGQACPGDPGPGRTVNKSTKNKRTSQIRKRGHQLGEGKERCGVRRSL